MCDSDSKKHETIKELLELTDRHRARFEGRRGYEWKLSLGLWSGLALLAGSLAKGEGPVSLSPWWLLPAGLILVFLLFAFVWLPGIAWRHDDDRTKARNCLDQAEWMIREKHQAESFEGLEPTWEESPWEPEKEVAKKEVAKEKASIWERFCKCMKRWRKSLPLLIHFSYSMQIVITLVLAALVILAAISPDTSKLRGQNLKLSYTTTQPSKHLSVTIDNE